MASSTVEKCLLQHCYYEGCPQQVTKIVCTSQEQDSCVNIPHFSCHVHFLPLLTSLRLDSTYIPLRERSVCICSQPNDADETSTHSCIEIATRILMIHNSQGLPIKIVCLCIDHANQMVTDLKENNTPFYLRKSV